MKKIYKYLLFSMFIVASVYFTYQHQTDPIYQLKVGTSVNLEREAIEDWGGHFNEDENIYIGFKTRLDPGTIVTVKIHYFDGIESEDEEITIIEDKDFYYFDFGTLEATDYRYEIIYNGEVIESTTFIVQKVEEN